MTEMGKCLCLGIAKNKSMKIPNRGDDKQAKLKCSGYREGGGKKNTHNKARSNIVVGIGSEYGVEIPTR